MKKFYLFCLIIFLLALIPLKSQNLYNIFSYAENLKVTFYVNKVVAENLDCEVIFNGNGAMVNCNAKESEKINNTLKNKYGESVIFNGNIDEFNLAIKKLNGKIIMCEYFDNERVAYGFSNLLGKGILIDGKIVNFQIALRNDTIVVGSPLIFGSF